MGPLQVFQELIVSRVRANPEPDHNVAVLHSKSSVGQSDTSREYWTHGMDLFEMKTSVPGILPKDLISTPRPLLHLVREGGE